MTYEERIEVLKETAMRKADELQEAEYRRWAENTETCVCCGAEIPEGRQVCPRCEKEGSV